MSIFLKKLLAKNFHFNSEESPEIILLGDGNDFIWATTSPSEIFSGAGKDRIFTGWSDDFIHAGTGRDRVFAGRGDDIIHGDTGLDFLFGGSGHDLIKGGEGHDTLYGQRGDDTLIGGYGKDTIKGGDGHDELMGGHGNDKLIGGVGADAFHFTLKQTQDGWENEGKDTIYDFRTNDKLVFHGIQSIKQLNQAISIRHKGSILKLKFQDGSWIKLKNMDGEDIQNAWDLADSLTIEFQYEYRNINGEYNHIDFQMMGASETSFLRMGEADYADGHHAPAGENRPSARLISNKLFAQTDEAPNPMNASDMFWLWGQFVDHDIDLTMEGSGEAFDIPVPMGDMYFDPMMTGTQVIPFMRSGYDESVSDNRVQMNGITSYIDASMVYGADELRADYLKNPDGTLKTSQGNLLPFNNGFFENAGGHGTNLFLAGDVRANENVALTSLHTLFVLEHNRLVDEFEQQNAHWTGEQLYQEARMIVGAQIQAITYNEFLPLLVGQANITPYAGYDASIDPRISTEFASAAYRLGHTMLSSEVERLSEDGSIAGSHLQLREAFFNPSILQADGIDSILRGVAQGRAQSIDLSIIDDVRNFLFGPPGAGGLDLGALNVQRGRDHGLDDYNALREAYGLEKVTDFTQITSDVSVSTELASLYDSVDDIDLFVGLLAEDPIPGSQLGELLQTIILDQFERTRDGDRFWYENVLDPNKVEEINKLKLSDIIELNTSIDNIQNEVFISYHRQGGDHLDNTLTGTQASDLLIGLEGDDTLNGQDGMDELIGGAGNDILSGGEGKDTFVFKVGFDLDVILDFALNHDVTEQNDQIELSDFQTSFDELTITQSGADAQIHLGGPDMITLVGVDSSLINENDFLF